ncbi:MAG: methyl-accepting chemotaxis protein [Planctomycetota bacterium]
MSTRSSLFDRFQNWAPVEAIATKIRAKLLLTLVGVSIVPLLALGIVMYRSASSGILNQANQQLESVRTIKANQVQGYFDNIAKQVLTFSEDRMIVDAMKQFPGALKDSRNQANVSDAQLAKMRADVEAYYRDEFGTVYAEQNGVQPPVDAQLAGLDKDTVFLQHQYISANPHPLGSKELLDQADDGSQYSKLHGTYHPVVRNYLKQFGYYDIFLCDLESGDIVYSVFKELDFTTSLKDGPYAETNFGRAFRLAAAAENKDDYFLVDYEPYLPSYEGAASFISSPVFDGDKKIGVAIFQMPIEKINEIMGERTGLGETGETYAVGADGLFRSESRFADDLGVATTIINPEVQVKTFASQAALQGKSGTAIIDDYRGTSVLSSWTPITVYPGIEGITEPIRWALMSEIDYAEVTQPITATGLARNAGMIIVVGLVLGLVCALWFAQGVTRQAESINDMLMMIGIGDFDARADVVTRDELGDVATALNAMCDNTLSLIQSREERDQIETSIMELIQEVEEIAAGDLTISTDVRDDMTGSIAGSVNYMTSQLREIVRRVQEATLEVNQSAEQVREISGNLSSQSLEQAERITNANADVRQITDSIQEVAAKTRDSAEVASKARETAAQGLQAVSDTVDGMQRIRNQVQETSKRIKRLGESSQEIGEIVQLISDIADRTSILALNASIQAAMAGDAGQGFAVVAEEVERLAERSNDATKQISTLIKAIQTETGEAITDMEESTREVVEGSKLATQAGATLSEIDRVSTILSELVASVSGTAEEQAASAKRIAGSMEEISSSTRESATQSTIASQSVGRLAELATELRESVSQFRIDSDTAMGESDASYETVDAGFMNQDDDLGVGDHLGNESALVDDAQAALALAAEAIESTNADDSTHQGIDPIELEAAFAAEDAMEFSNENEDDETA